MFELKYFDEYVEKYGLHFTRNLAEKVSSCTCKEVEEILRPMVWYNLTRATTGDITYIYCVELSKGRSEKNAAIRTINRVGDYFGPQSLQAFPYWILELKRKNRSFDFKEYI